MASNETSTLLIEKHVAYIKSLDTNQDELDYWMSEHLRLNGVYWGLSALCLLGHQDALDRTEIIKYVKSCQTEEGGFGAHTGHDAHILNTLSAVQLLAIEDALDTIDHEKIDIISLQNLETGAFSGSTIYAEYDTRFIYCAFQTLALLKALDRIDISSAVQYIHRCRNFDGGFGLAPYAESHSGQVFTCLGALAIVGQLHIPENKSWIDTCGWWLCERQLPMGGMNGRPEKLEDDPEKGGIADRPGDVVDVFHTYFGIAGLSLMGYKGIGQVNEVYSLPVETIRNLGLQE